MPATTTSLANLFAPVVESQQTMVKYVNRSLLRAMADAKARAGHSMPFDVVGLGRGSQFQWNVNRGTGNSSTQLFDETTATPAAGQQTYARMALTWVNFRNIIDVSRIAMDDLQGANVMGGPEFSEAQGIGEVTGALDDIQDMMNGIFVGSTNNGILAGDDDGTNVPIYAGQNRTVLLDLASALTPVGGALTLGVISDLEEELSDDPRGVAPDAWFAPNNQVTNYVRLVGPEAALPLVRYNAPLAGGAAAVDGGVDRARTTIGGKPLYGIPELLDTVFLGLSMADWFFINHRVLRRDPLAITGDSAMREQISTRATLACLRSRHQGILTGVNA
ncbi:MAG: hypothetical protein ABII82_01950 [Verrucomicrobiota bacterium]